MTTKLPGGAGKRCFDLTVAIAGLIVFAPLLGVIAVALKLSSRGPVLFLQERIGWHGRIFRIIKFRSMVRNARYIRNPDGSAYSSDTDLRVTRLGRILRRTSLDELPQLWNVVRGEMSLIGPRPELAGLENSLQDHCHDHAQRRHQSEAVAGVARTRSGGPAMFNGKLGALLPFDEAALPLVRAWINDEEVRRGTGTEGPVSDWEHRRWYESVMDDPAQRIFLIAQGHGRKPVGALGLRGINWRSRHAEYWIYLGDHSARGKGLAAEASRLLLRFAFNTLGLHRVFLQVNVTNQSAISLYRRLGFVEEGILRAAVFADGRFVDRLLLSMLSHEFGHLPE
jgi:lipopolysaccharide/colanic/teichoic acid biosynthesis glycosyltransferase/ribosomal protein S18 acetylase RimI-like enzyme